MMEFKTYRYSRVVPVFPSHRQLRFPPLRPIRCRRPWRLEPALVPPAIRGRGHIVAAVDDHSVDTGPKGKAKLRRTNGHAEQLVQCLFAQALHEVGVREVGSAVHVVGHDGGVLGRITDQ